MSFKTILVSVDASATAARTVKAARELAERFDAHVIGLHVRPRFQSPAFTDSGFGMETLYTQHLEKVTVDAETAAATFKNAMGTRVSEWRVIDGFIDDELAVAARYADLVVIAQADAEGSSSSMPSDLPERVALTTERPVLVVPYIGAIKAPGKTVLLCWNASRESSRAATAAMPFLEKADKVVVLTIDAKASESGHGAEPGADVAEWLSRHGAKVTVQRDTAADNDIGATILSRAADHGADLIVMGVYGHSRMREFVMGGVSRTLLSSMTAPLLIAH